MSDSLQFLLALSFLLAGARVGGLISKRLGQPVVLGELLAGVLLGPSLINFLHFPWFTSAQPGESIQRLAELGVIFLLFLAGLKLTCVRCSRAGGRRRGRAAAESWPLSFSAWAPGCSSSCRCSTRFFSALR